MSDELTIDGEQFVSSKRASELSGYKQDYIGQLSRGGQILARRVGGLWYVSSDSLTKYMARAEAYKPVPPINDSRSDPDTLLSFDGRGHISASRAAKLTGYSPDYVGQMARAGIIASRQVGNRWYVERDDILSHKESKDALLAAVQVQSVGLKTPATPEARSMEGDYTGIEPFFRYTSDNRELIPTTGESADFVARPESADRLQVPTIDRSARLQVPTIDRSARLQVPMSIPSAFVARPADAYPIGPSITPGDGRTEEENAEEDEHIIPIRVRSYQGPSQGPTFGRNLQGRSLGMPVLLEPRRALLPMVLTGLFTVVIVLSLGFISLKKSSIYISNSTDKGEIAAAQLASTGMDFIDRAGDLLESLIVPEIIYRR